MSADAKAYRLQMWKGHHRAVRARIRSAALRVVNCCQDLRTVGLGWMGDQGMSNRGAHMHCITVFCLSEIDC